MPTYSLTAAQCLLLGVVLVAGCYPVIRLDSSRWARWASCGYEIGLLALLDALWMYAGSKSVVSDKTAATQAVRHSHWLLSAEHRLHLPDERLLIDFVAHRPVLAQVFDLYYALMHFTMMGVFLVWLFLRHRDRYRSIRTTMGLFTAISLVIQLIPVAPPRLLGDGFIDVAARYGQSVYHDYGSWSVAQLSAMPSVHVGWAVLIAWATLSLSTSPWRWLGPAHAVITVLVVVGTANHFWADGIVAAALLIGTRYAQLGTRAALTQAVPSLEPVHAG